VNTVTAEYFGLIDQLGQRTDYE